MRKNRQNSYQRYDQNASAAPIVPPFEKRKGSLRPEKVQIGQQQQHRYLSVGMPSATSAQAASLGVQL